MRGKQNAFSQFRDVLAEQLCEAMPEFKGDVATVLRESRKGYENTAVQDTDNQSGHQESSVGLGVNVNGVDLGG